MSKVAISGVIAAALIALVTPTHVNAITNDKLAFLTFSGPVQVPGAVLDPGTYRFRLTNSETSRNVLQVLSNDGMIVYAMFHTLNDVRTRVTYADPVVTFIETPAGVPPATKTLFYPFESIGYEFVYPKGGPIMTAEVPPQPEITYSPLPAPAAEPVAEPEVEAAPEPAPEPEPAPAQEPAAPPAELPRTATPLPLVALGGLATLLAGLGVGLFRRTLN